MARTSVVFSIIFHALLFVAGAYWAAHEGMLGNKARELAASILDKEKKPEVKKDEPKEEAKKAEAAQEVKAIKTAAAAASQEKFIPPPPAADVAAAPPPPVTIGDFVFNQSDVNDPVVHYKQQVETALRSKWNRPSDILDLAFVAEVEVSIDSTGRVVNSTFKKGSGDNRWDDSVRRAVASTRAFNRPPPSGFPPTVLVRFDVQQETETILQ